MYNYFKLIVDAILCDHFVTKNIFQAEARRMKVKESRKRREERQALKKEELLKVNI